MIRLPAALLLRWLVALLLLRRRLPLCLRPAIARTSAGAWRGERRIGRPSSCGSRSGFCGRVRRLPARPAVGRVAGCAGRRVLRVLGSDQLRRGGCCRQRARHGHRSAAGPARSAASPRASLSDKGCGKRILQQNSLARHWARDWRALALTQRTPRCGKRNRSANPFLAQRRAHGRYAVTQNVRLRGTPPEAGRRAPATQLHLSS